LSAKVKYYVFIFVLLTLAIIGLIWKENSYQVFSPAWVIQATVPLLLCLLSIIIYLTFVLIKLRSSEKFLSAN
jgi:hypothetical protein